jgi:hypothetical protein
VPSKRYEVVPELTLGQLATYHNDVVAALRLYFSSASPAFGERYFGKPPSEALQEAARELETRLNESDIRSSLMVLTGLEAHFNLDFEYRCRNRLRAPLSRYFRDLERERKGRVRLDDDIP